MNKTKVLLLLLCAGLAGVVVGYRSADFGPATPTPLQLIKPVESAAPVPSAAAPAIDAPATMKPPAVTSAPAPSNAARSKPAPRGKVQPAAPAGPLSASVTPPPAPATSPAPVAEKGADADDYQVQASARMQQGDYRRAGELFEAALRSGGTARFTIVHDHSKGNFEKDPKASCVGELILSSDAITFDGVGAGDSHHFEATWADVLDAGANKFFGSGLGGFHVAINPDGKYKNFNLAPRSKDKSEARLIVDLLNANARKTERGK